MSDIIKTITPIHFTGYTCKECGGRIKWAFIPVEAHWKVEDNDRVWVPYNWYLDVYCFCGEVKNKAIVEECYNEHRQLACDEIHRQQNERLEAVLGIELAGHIHDLNGGSF